MCARAQANALPAGVVGAPCTTIGDALAFALGASAATAGPVATAARALADEVSSQVCVGGRIDQARAEALLARLRAAACPGAPAPAPGAQVLLGRALAPAAAADEAPLRALSARVNTLLRALACSQEARQALAASLRKLHGAECSAAGLAAIGVQLDAAVVSSAAPLACTAGRVDGQRAEALGTQLLADLGC